MINSKHGRPFSRFRAVLESSKSYHKPYVAQEIVDLASRKLFGLAPQDGFRSPYESLALLDLRLCLDYSSSKRSLETQKTLCESHMRYTFSVPQDQVNFQSGYCSEPVLAEAAAQKQFFLRYEPEEHLKSLFSDGTLNASRRGGIAARLLFTKAYDLAVVHEHGEPDNDAGLFFSQGCHLPSFIKKLFGEVHAKRLLNSVPDNFSLYSESCQTFEDTFARARLRFTHFVPLSPDDSCGTTASFMFAAFLRGAAVITEGSHGGVDIMIPILLDEDRDVSPEAMSAILVQVRTRKWADSGVEYVIEAEQVDLFPCMGGAADGRPYVSLVMELGANASERSSSITTTTPESRCMGATTHPRFGICTYGCSPKTFAVITEEQALMYANIFANTIGGNEVSPRPMYHPKAAWNSPGDCAWMSDPFFTKVSSETGDEGQTQVVQVDDAVAHVGFGCGNGGTQ